MNVHIVVKGDTLWKIARQYGISFEELKKVNAHLANPDYIVPGMKIFLPEGGKGTKHPEKHGGKEKHPLPQEKPVKPETPAPEVPKKPKPLPPIPEAPKPVPKPEVKPPVKPPVTPQPIPKPEVKPPPKPAPKPQPPSQEAPPVAPVPPVSPVPPVPQQPVVHPMFIGIPCGWMPIYDADCHPHVHPMQHHMHQPHHQQNHHHQHYQQHQQQPKPPAMPQAPIQPPQWNFQPDSPSCPDESPIKPGQGPGVSPPHCDSMKTWELPDPQVPNIESSGFDLSPPAYCPPEQGYVPQQVPHQMPQQEYPNHQQVPMPGIYAAQHPHLMHLCTSCGSTMSPTPYYGMPTMGMHPYYGSSPQMGYPATGNNEQNQMGPY